MYRSAILGLLAACGGHHAPGDAGFASIQIVPADATLTVTLGGKAMQDYQVLGVTGSATTDITASCALTIDPTFGAFAGAALTVGPHGGKTMVTANCGAQSGSTGLVVDLVGSIVVGNAPPGSAGLFGGATAGGDLLRMPVIEYPLDGAVSPLNIPPIEFQWTAAGNDLFHLALVTAFSKIDVYTSDVQAIFAATDWDAITATAAGSQLSIAVEGLAQAMPAQKFGAPPIAITMSRDAIDKTAIYYWASSQGDLMTQKFGAITAPSIVKNDCTSCHSVSRTGSRIGYSRCVANDCNKLYAGFMHYDTNTSTWIETVDANAMTIQGSYTTFAPVGTPFQTDDHSLAIVTMGTSTLALYDPDTGAPVPSNIVVATHGPNAPRAPLIADCSAAGDKVVFASSPKAGDLVDLD